MQGFVRESPRCSHSGQMTLREINAHLKDANAYVKFPHQNMASARCWKVWVIGCTDTLLKVQSSLPCVGSQT